MRRPGATRAARARCARSARRSCVARQAAQAAPAAAVSGVSVVVPVKDGERYLAELLDALAREGVDEVLVIDSGSRDRSLEIARAAGVRAARDRARRVRPRPHAQPRRRAHRGRADLLPDAGRHALPGLARRLPRGVRARRARRRRLRPAPAAPRHEPDDRARADRVLRVVSPRRARRSSSAPAIRPSSPTSTPATRAPAGRRSASATSPTPRTRRSARDMLAAGWAKVYHPGAAVLHAHDYGALEFMRRYFDEYRGLRETTGHVEPLRLPPRARSRRGGRRSSLDGRARRRRRRAAPAGRRARRRTTAAGASSRRSARAPSGCPRRCAGGSRSRAATTRPRRDASAGRGRRLDSPLVGRQRRRRSGSPGEDYDVVARVWREGPAPLLEPVPGMAERERLRLAMVIPPFSRGSGGHNTLFQIFTRLEQRGHACSVWVARLPQPDARRGPARAAQRHARVLRADRGAGLQGLRRLAGRRRRDRHRLADGAPDAAARPAAARAPTSSTTTSPSSTRPRSSSVLAERHLPPRPALHRREPVAARPPDRALRRERRRLPAGRRPRRLPAARRSRGATTRSSTTRATRPRGAPCRSG